jgi:hypothetical protein
VTYAHKIEKARRDRLDAAGRGHRAAHPRLRSLPWRQQHAGGETVKLWAARAAGGGARPAPGTVWPSRQDGIAVACGEGRLCVTELQRPGGKRLAVRRFPARLPAEGRPALRLMFFLRSIHSHPEFREGMREMSPVAPGIAAWGLMTGVAMVKSGMSVIEAVAMTLLVYAGSSQLAAIPLIVAGAPAWVIWATGFCVNLRFVVFSLHLRPYLMHLPRWRRLVNGFLTADMSYALFTRRYPQPATDRRGRRAQESYLAGNYFVTWCPGPAPACWASRSAT